MYCNALRRTATHCNKLQGAATILNLTHLLQPRSVCGETHYNALQQPSTTHCNKPLVTYLPRLQSVGGAQQCTATHYNALQRTATHSNALQRTTMYCNALQCTATHYNVLHDSATTFNCHIYHDFDLFNLEMTVFRNS